MFKYTTATIIVLLMLLAPAGANKALAQTGYSPLVQQLLFARDDDDRENAAEQLAMCGTPADIPYLQWSAAYDREDDVRKDAAKAIQKIQERFATYAPPAPAPYPTYAAPAPEPTYAAPTYPTPQYSYPTYSAPTYSYPTPTYTYVAPTPTYTYVAPTPTYTYVAPRTTIVRPPVVIRTTPTYVAPRYYGGSQTHVGVQVGPRGGSAGFSFGSPRFGIGLGFSWGGGRGGDRGGRSGGPGGGYSGGHDRGPARR